MYPLLPIMMMIITITFPSIRRHSPHPGVETLAIAEKSIKLVADDGNSSDLTSHPLF